MSAVTDLVISLRELKPKLRAQYRAKGIELFGSCARGEQSLSSDVDILVEFEEGADLFDLIGLATFLEEQLKRRVDVVPRRALREELRESILRDAIPV